MHKVRAKFRVDWSNKVAWNPEVRVVRLSAVCADGVPENERFHKYTPSGSLEITIDNPPAAEFFESRLGKSIYIDFEPVGD